MDDFTIAHGQILILTTVADKQEGPCHKRDFWPTRQACYLRLQVWQHDIKCKARSAVQNCTDNANADASSTVTPSLNCAIKLRCQKRWLGVPLVLRRTRDCADRGSEKAYQISEKLLIHKICCMIACCTSLPGRDKMLNASGILSGAGC